MVTTHLQEIINHLRKDGVAGIPTETVYGLGANACSDSAVKKIYETKNRPTFNPLIVHFSSLGHLRSFSHDIPELVFKLAPHFWPGPLTLIIPASPKISSLVTAGLTTMGVRVPAHPLTQKLIEQCGFPLAAPSANPSGSLSPVNASDVSKELHIPVLDGGPCQIGIESTILDITQYPPKILRPGAISADDLISFIPEITPYKNFSNSNPTAPGQLHQHYAPQLPMFWMHKSAEADPSQAARILFTAHPQMSEYDFALAPNGKLEEAARNLFTMLRKAQQLPVQKILIEKIPGNGLADAINDRINRGTMNPDF